MKTLPLALIGFSATLLLSHGQTTLLNQSQTVDYTKNTSANLGAIVLEGNSTLTLDDTASVSVTDTIGSDQFPGTNASNVDIGGAETIIAENSGPGKFTFNLGNLGRTTGSGTTIDYVVENTGGGSIALNSSTRISDGGSDEDSVTYWAFYDGNDWAATSTVTGGAIISAAAEYNDGGKDTTATNLSTWSSNTFEDYTNDLSSTYSGVLTGSATKAGIRISNAAGAALNLGGYTLTNAAILDAQGAGAATISNGTITGGEIIINQNNTANNLTISTNIAGNVSDFAKTGVGKLILTGENNTYSGATYINQGTLQVDGTLSLTSKVILAQGATLSGTGTINAAVTAGDSTSVIAAGDPGQIGTLNLNAITATSGLTLDFKLDGDGNTFGTDNDFIDVGGLTLGGTVNVNFTTLDSILTDTPYLLMAGNVWSGSPTFDFTTPAGYAVESYDYDTTFNEFTVEFEAVPEPSIFAMLLGGAGLLGLVLRRKRGQI